MLTSFVIALREGLEAALILAIILTFLGRTGAPQLKRYVWYGMAAALAGSLTAGVLLFTLAQDLAEEAGETFEIVVTLMAAAMIVFMVIWMKRHGGELKAHLERKTGKASAGASASASAAAIFLLALTAVGREGLETVLFLLGSSTSEGVAVTLLGASAGLAVAVAAGYALHSGAYRIDLRKFFNVTGVLLIVFAAGLVANIAGEVAGEGLVPSFMTGTVWDAGSWLSQEQGMGALLHSLFGYQSQPTLLALSAYVLFLGSMLWIFFRPGRARMMTDSRVPSQGTSQDALPEISREASHETC